MKAAEHSLKTAVSRSPEISRTTAALRYERVDVNHIAERVKKSWGVTE